MIEKKPFLRKGVGLQRFRMKLDDVWLDAASEKSSNRSPLRPALKSAFSGNPAREPILKPVISQASTSNHAKDPPIREVRRINFAPVPSVSSKLSTVPTSTELFAKNEQYLKESTKVQNDLKQYDKWFNFGLKSLNFGPVDSNQNQKQQTTTNVQDLQRNEPENYDQDKNADDSDIVEVQIDQNCSECAQHNPLNHAQPCEASLNDNESVVSCDPPPILTRQSLLKEWNELNVAKRTFEREKREAEQQLQVTRANFDKIMREERQKLAKDKLVYEKHIKTRSDQPRKDRESIKTLEVQVNELSKKIKEETCKNAAMCARYREHIRRLEADLTKLRKENATLTKQNATWKAHNERIARMGDAKVLHEANNLLTKAIKKNEDVLRKKIEKSPGVAKKSAKTPKKRVVIHPWDNSSSDEENFQALGNVPTSILKKSVPKDYRLSGGKGPNPNDGLQFGDFSRDYEKLQNRPISSKAAQKVTCFSNVVNDDGSKLEEINGVLKETSANGQVKKIRFPDGSTRVVNNIQGFTEEYDATTKSRCKTIHDDGKKIFTYDDGTIEEVLKSGYKEIRKIDGTVITIDPTNENEYKKQVFANGVRSIENKDGNSVTYFPDGRIEYYRKDFVRVEHPLGWVKTKYADGSTISKYPDGRVRKRDGSGKIIEDTFHSAR